MRLTGTRIAIVASSLIAASAFAQEVGSTKKSGKLTDLVSSQSGAVELRNYVNEVHDGKDRTSIEREQVITQARAYLGVKTFKDKLDTTLVLGVANKSGENGVVSVRQPQLYSELLAFDSEFFSLSPYLDLYAPHSSSKLNPSTGARESKKVGSRGELGLRPVLKHPAIITAAGDLNFELSVEAEGVFKSGPSDAEYASNSERTRGSSLGLAASEDEGDTKIPGRESNQMAYEVMYAPRATLNMNRLVSGLSVYSYGEYTNTYSPVETVDESGKYETVFQASRGVRSVAAVKYKVNETLSLTNEFSAFNGGFYDSRGEDGGENTVYGNLAYITYNLY